MANPFRYALFKNPEDEKIIDRYIDKFQCKGKDGKTYKFAILVKHSTGTCYVSTTPGRIEKQGEFLCMNVKYYGTTYRSYGYNAIYAFFFRKDKREDWQLNDEFDIKLKGLENNDLGSQIYPIFEREAKKFGVKELKMYLSSVDACTEEELNRRNHFWKKMGFNVYPSPGGCGYVYKKL